MIREVSPQTYCCSDRSLAGLAVALIWIGLGLLGSIGASAEFRVTYIANEGFLLEGDGKKGSSIVFPRPP